MAEYEKTIELQRPGSTKWSSQVTAASVLLKTQGAMEKAVFDSALKSEFLASGTPEHRKAAIKAASAVKDDTNWEQLSTVVGLLEPVKLALDNAQSNGRGLGKVRSAMFRLSTHFSSSYPPSTLGTSLKQDVMKSFHERERFTLRAVHALAYLLDPRYADHPSQPDTTELSEALNLLCSLAAAHDVKLALTCRPAVHPRRRTTSWRSSPPTRPSRRARSFCQQSGRRER